MTGFETTIQEHFEGRNVIIRTVTHYYTGTIVHAAGDGVLLFDAAWIADTGGWSNALTTGQLDAVEPYPQGYVYVSGIIDISIWNHPLPRTTI